MLANLLGKKGMNMAQCGKNYDSVCVATKNLLITYFPAINFQAI